MQEHFKKHWEKYLWGLVIVAPMVLYIINFGRSGISGDPANWGAFGDYVGGIYSVLVTVLVIYLARMLNRKDTMRREKQEAAVEVYKQIQKINNQNVDLRSVNKLLRDIESNSIYFSDDLTERLTNLFDYFTQLKAGTTNIDEGKEQRVLTELKRIYES